MKRAGKDPRPVTGVKKLMVVLGWALLGAALGTLAYPFIWQFVQPDKGLNGMSEGVNYLTSSPLGWVFVAGSAWGLSLVPRVASENSTAENYHEHARLLGLRWLAFMVIATGIVIVLVQSRKIPLDLLPLFLLAVPLPAAGMVKLGPIKRRGSMDGF